MGNNILTDLEVGKYEVTVNEVQFARVVDHIQRGNPIRITTARGDDVWIYAPLDNDDIIVEYEKQCNGKQISIEPL